MARVPEPDTFDMRLAFRLLQAEDRIRKTFDQAMADSTIRTLIHARALKLLSARAKREREMTDHKAAACGDFTSD
ncbi:MAG: hypothetical protein AB3X44_16170 [Leptothrix sp. (in: b-proteobacteria)]